MSATNRTTSRGGKGSKGDKTNKPDKGDTGKGLMDKVHQSGGGDNVRSNKNEDPSMKEKIRQIIELTETTENEACLALHESENDTERAINFIFENRNQNWETRVKKKKSRQNSTSKDGAAPAAAIRSTDTSVNNSAVATTASGGGDDDDWEDGPTNVTSSGNIGGSGNIGASTAGGGNADKGGRGGGRSVGPRMYGRQGGGGNRDRDGGGLGWRGRERHENERNLDEGGSGGRRGRPGLPPRGSGGARGRGGGRAGGSGRYPPRAPQNRQTNSNYNNRGSSMGTWDNSNTWDGGSTREEVNHHSTAADDNWDELRGEEWSAEEYTGSLSETKVFTSSQPTEPTPQEQDQPSVIPTMETANNSISTSSTSVEQSIAQLAQMSHMQQAAVAAVSVHQSAGGTVPPPQQQQQQPQQVQQSQPQPVAIVGTLNAEQAKYLNTLTQQSNMNSSGGAKYTQQQPSQQSIQQPQLQVQSQYGVTQTQTTGYMTNYAQPYTDSTMQQQPRTKQRARIPPPSKIPSSAVEMPGDLNTSMGLLDLQFGAMDIMLDGTGGGVIVGGYDSNDGKYSTSSMDTSGVQQQSSTTTTSMDLNASSVQHQNVPPQQHMVDAYSPTKPIQQQQGNINSQNLSGESMQSGGVTSNAASGGDHLQPGTGYNTGVRSGVAVASSTTGTNTSVGGVVSVGVGVGAIDTLNKVQQANVVDQQQQQQAQQAAAAAAAAAAQQQQHAYSQQANYNTAYGSGPTNVVKSIATAGSNYQTQQQAYSTGNYNTNTQKPTDFQTANVTANYNYTNNNGGGSGPGSTAYNTSAAPSNHAYQTYSATSNSYQQSSGSGSTPFITQANTYPVNAATNPAYQQNTSQSVYGANTGLNNSSNYAGSSNSTAASAQYNSYGSGSGSTTASNHKSKDGSSVYDSSNNAVGVSGAVTTNANSAAAAAAAAALSLTQTTATSGSKVNTTLAKNSSGVVTNLPPGVTPVMSTQYLMASSTIPYFQQPIYQYDDLQMMQQRIPHITTPYYDMGYQTPGAATTLRDGSYSMPSDGRFARNDSNASPVPSTQTNSQPMALAQTAPGPYFFTATPYTNIQPGYQFGPAMYSQLPAGTNAAHSANNSTPQYAKQQQQPTAATPYSGGYGSAYDSLSQAQDYGKNPGGGYVGGGAGGGSGGGAGGGSQPGQSKAGGGGASNAVSASSGTASGAGGTGGGGSTNDLSAMYAKTHNTLGKVNSYEKQGFHSGTPPPFTGTLGQSGTLAPSGTGYAPQMYIQPLPPHHQQHTTPLMHQPLHQDGGNSSGQRSQSSNPSKTGSKQGYQASYWNPS